MPKGLTSPIGLVLILAGAVALYFAYEFGNPVWAAIAWAAIIIGAFLLIYGIHRFVSNFLNPPVNVDIQHGPTEIRLLIQSMGVVARADGKVEDKEIETIEAIHARMLGIRINPVEVDEILSEFGPDFDIRTRLEKARSKISPLMKRKIVHACHLVMMSDLQIDASEVSKVHEIGHALGFSDTEIDEIIAVAET